MGSWIKKNVISVTRGDSLWTVVNIKDSLGEEYIPDSRDVIRFSLKTTTSDDEAPLVVKEISPETLELKLNPEDTDFDPGVFWYDVEATLNNGFVCTIIEPTKFIIREQVGDKRRWP